MNETLSLIVKIITVTGTTIAGCFAVWKWYRRPFKQDRDRYQRVMSNINPPDIYYFRVWDSSYHKFPQDRYDNIWASAMALRDLSNYAPNFIDKQLLKKEKKLLDALNELLERMGRRLSFYQGSSRLTIYRSGYDATNLEHIQEADEVITELNEALNHLIEAFEDFRDCGNRKFAERLPL